MANKNIFCNVPWFHLNIRHDGTFEMCCSQRSGSKNADGSAMFAHNIKTSTIAEWWNSSTMQGIRQQILSDKPLPTCAGCYKDDEHNNESYRLTQNWRSAIFTKQAFDQSFAESPHLKIFKEDGLYDGMPIDLHIDLGNECNLACKFCGPDVSTKIASKFKTWGLIDKDTVLRKDWAGDDAVWDRFCNEVLTIKNLQSVHFMGGEPTLSPRLADFLDFFISHNRTDFCISFVTNGTKFRYDLIDKLKKFKRVDIDVSIESILDNNYYIRQGLDKETFQTNVKLYLQEQTDNLFICLKPSISALSAPTYPELIEFFLDNNIITESNTCWDPAYMQIAVLPYAVKQSYLPKYERLLTKLEGLASSGNLDMVRSRMVDNNAVNLYKELKSVYNMLIAPELNNAEELRKELVYWLNKWDCDLKQDARDYYPEWSEFLEKYDYKKISNTN